MHTAQLRQAGAGAHTHTPHPPQQKGRGTSWRAGCWAVAYVLAEAPVLIVGVLLASALLLDLLQAVVRSILHLLHPTALILQANLQVAALLQETNCGSGIGGKKCQSTPRRHDRALCSQQPPELVTLTCSMPLLLRLLLTGVLHHGMTLHDMT